ncbi:MAG: ribokinase [Cyanobacteriota bacterium]|nr:ribokinase [Cyanobacteriota bacterium]
MRAIVFGSINMDLVTRVPRFPRSGETLMGSSFSTVPGGKGANQAVAAARLGIPTTMVGRVGGDEFGEVLLDGLRESGVDVGGVTIDDRTHSGVAAIAIDARGENNIIVVPGANDRVNSSDLQNLETRLPSAKVLLVQLEIPLETVRAAVRLARNAGVRVAFDPAPVPADFPRQLYREIDIITPNEVEASQLTGICVESPESAALAADRLRAWGVGTAIVKLGAQGVYCATADDSFFVPAFAVDAVDTVAAGDAFNGALAAAIVGDLSWHQAVTRAAAAGAIATTQPGARSALCDRPTLEAFLQERGM